MVLLAIAFGVYKFFLSDGHESPPPYSEYPPYSDRYQRFTNSAGLLLQALSLSSQDRMVQQLVLAVLSPDSKGTNVQDRGSGLAWEPEGY